MEGYEGYEGLCQYAEDTKDLDVSWKIAVVEKYGERTPELIERIREHETAHEQNAGESRRTIERNSQRPYSL